MSLDMLGHIDETFKSATGTRFAQSGSRGTDGRWVEGAETATTHDVTIQPLSEREAANLGIGGERIEDYRRVYVNDGDLYAITPRDQWEFDASDLVGQRFKAFRLDNRPWRNYCKIIVSRIDNQ